jgi:hypothetical protein
MTPKQVYTKSDGTTYTAMAWVYNAGDGAGIALRHKHPVNVPLSNFDNNPNTAVDVITGDSLAVPVANDGAGDAATKDPSDWIECLTCHRAHGTSAIMTGYAADGSLAVDPATGVPVNNYVSATPSALLRLDNRGVCESCHNK